MTLTEKNLSKRIIFTYLEDVKNSFISYLQNEHKDEYGCIDEDEPQMENSPCNNGSYAFARFGLSWIRELWLDKEIQQKRRQYDDQNGNLDSYNQINESLIDIQNIMRKNIDEVVQRVEKLDRKCSNSHLE